MTPQKPGAEPPRYHFLGIWVNALDVDALNSLVRNAITHRQRWLIAHHNLHSVKLIRDEPEMREFYERADFIHIDGMPLVWLGRLFGHRLERSHRVTYVDWLPPLMQLAASHGWRVFYLGGKPGIAEQGASVLRDRFAGLEVATRHGYFDAAPNSSDSHEIVAEIERFGPDILMVGMGMPRQERWIGSIRHLLTAPVILPAGASFDYFAGAIPTPPRWSGRLGLEWLFRLLSEPRRLGRRYLIEPWSIAPLVLSELIRSITTRPRTSPPDDSDAPRG